MENETSESPEKRPHALQIFVIWMITSAFFVICAAIVTSEIIGMPMIIPLGASLLAVGFSLFHPGGWLGLSGLIIAIKTRKYAWLALSFLGAILTGITAPMFEWFAATGV